MWLDAAYHKTKIVLDEDGTEVTAATAFVGVDASLPPTPVPVQFERPFVFFIREHPSLFRRFLGSYRGKFIGFLSSQSADTVRMVCVSFSRREPRTIHQHGRALWLFHARFSAEKFAFGVVHLCV